MNVQLVQIAGSLLILAGFVGNQAGRLTTTSRLYLTLNLVGSSVLALLAALDVQLGFLLLEGVWAVVSARGLIAVLRGRSGDGASGRDAHVPTTSHTT